MVVPEDVGGRLRAIANGAGEIDGTALVHMEVWASQDGCRWDWKHQTSRFSVEGSNLELCSGIQIV